MQHITDQLAQSIKEKKSPIVIGLDPVYENLPKSIKEQHSQDLQGVAEAFLEFGTHVIDAVADSAAAIKPQSAFYELLGWRGIQALEESIAYAKAKGLIVVEDSKRGDIGSTSAAYADAHIGSLTIDGKTLRESEADFMTVSPFLGIDGLEPFITTAAQNNRGVFILVRTSNPGSSLIQHAITETQRTVAEELAAYIANSSASCGLCGYSSIGAVVGATYSAEAQKLRALMPKSFFLVPGYGAQGATAEDIVPFFNDDGLGALINASRSVIYAYKKVPNADESVDTFKAATQRAAKSMQDDIYLALKASHRSLSY